MLKVSMLFLSALFLATAIFAEKSVGNLAPDPGFENSKDPKISQWRSSRKILKGTCGFSNEEKHSGEQSMHIKSTSANLKADDSPYGKLSVSTDFLPSPPPGTVIKYSLWGKCKDVVSPGKWYKARFVITFYDKMKKKLEHNALCSLEGSMDWKPYEGDLTVPENSVYMKLGGALAHCSGEVWFDDVSIQINNDSLLRKEAMKDLPTTNPVLIPSPWRTVFHKENIPLDKIFLKTLPSDAICNEKLKEILKEFNVSVSNSSGTKIIACDKKSGLKLFKESFPDNEWKEMGKQGYFLIAEKGKIIWGAPTEQGRFYAVQTLRQLIRDGRGKYARSVKIIDRPEIEKRGAVIGPHWFKNKEEAIRRMSRLKLNLAWNQGPLLNLKLSSTKSLKTFWRKPFNKKELNTLREYVELGRKNFIELCMAFSPRGYPPVHYSSSKEIDLAVAKLKALYDVGIKTIGIAFDDLQNIEQDKLFYKDDMEKFGGDLGKAHAYFVDSIYKKLKTTCPDINLTVLPYAYSAVTKLPEEGKRSIKYLKNFSEGLSPGIKNWVACLYSKKDIELSKEISGRKPFIWDNYYASRKLAAFPSPINRPSTHNNENIAGYMFLPARPINEDASRISWLNAADYEWAPSRYNPMESYRKAIVYVARSPEAVRLISDYSNFSLKIDDYKFPDKSKELRMQFLQEALKKLDSFPAQLKVLPPALAEAVEKDICRYKENLERIMANLKKRTYPGLIFPKEGFVRSEDNAFGNFIPFKSNDKPEDSKVWLCYDNEKLYINFIADEPEMGNISARRGKKDSSVFKDDSIEVFIMPEPEDTTGNSTYYQVVVNSKGAVYDAKYIHKRFNYLYDKFTDWNTDLDIKAVRNEKSWGLEIGIPFKDIEMASPEKGRRVYMNICRNRYAGNKTEYSCYSLLLKGKFHDPMSFWPMEFK